MFQVISFNVIRQALDWHGLPMPKLRILSFYSDELHTTAEYGAVWPEHCLPQRFFAAPTISDPRDGVSRFMDELIQCFAADVAVRQVRWSHILQEMSALLYVEVDTAIGNWHEHLLNINT